MDAVPGTTSNEERANIVSALLLSCRAHVVMARQCSTHRKLVEPPPLQTARLHDEDSRCGSYDFFRGGWRDCLECTCELRAKQFVDAVSQIRVHRLLWDSIRDRLDCLRACYLDHRDGDTVAAYYPSGLDNDLLGEANFGGAVRALP